MRLVCSNANLFAFRIKIDWHKHPPSPLDFFRHHLAAAVEQPWPERVHLADAATRTPPPPEVQAVRLPTAHFELQLAGEQRHGLSFDGRWHDLPLRPGELIYRVPDGWWLKYPPTPGDLLGLNFRHDTLRIVAASYSRDGGCQRKDYHTATPIGPDARGIMESLDELTRHGRNTPAAVLLVRALLHLARDHLIADEHADRGNKAEHTWRQVYLFLQEHYAEPLTRDVVADAVGPSPNYLSTLATNAHGRSFQETLEDIRLRARPPPAPRDDAQGRRRRPRLRLPRELLLQPRIPQADGHHPRPLAAGAAGPR